MKITQAVILAGGAGTRLKPFTLNNPKPMVLINKKPFLEHLLSLLKNNGIKEVVILTGYMGEKIHTHFKNNLWNGMKIQFSHLPFLDEHGEEIKSGLRVKNAEKHFDDFFLQLYCDNYWPLQLNKLVDFFRSHTSDALVTVFSNKDNSTKNNMFVDRDGYVTTYDKNREEKKLNGVDTGFFLVNKKILKLLPNTNSEFETLIPKLIETRKLSGLLTDQKYYSIGDMDRIPITAKFLAPKKVIFLDRDGTINEKAPKSDYIKSWKKFRFLRGAIDAIKLLNDNGYQIFLVSNQAGIARGKMTEGDLSDIHKNMLKELGKIGAKIHGIYYCPHGWDENCECRKPKPGMLFQASKDHHIDLTKTTFIGDDERDIEAGYDAGCKTILVEGDRDLLHVVNSIIK